MKVREVIKMLEDDGWYLARTKGSHRQFKHPEKAGTVTVSGNLGVDMPIGTLKSVWRQAQLEEEED
ncbi:type II toxin-antitoxin system HicA family toxin [Microcoleus sp. F10-C6]|jgi:predicted RNA binding protein YcfA (HicA-like mRNA interferase family)|uniref:type II toxin-antitoxin system HicA family toxin n=1 Tax=Microcoleaceae TaxID=1892252 RepID=UPI002237E8A8|nr:type II toxin-antitoxin system HicA family toxin [Lyngbya sp. CCAP 1446/10]MCW6051977.1 type II toxin-antitoxin system HicA family toxin [Lyngbya sp. CCAP 1446/10]HSF76884.1 type II toxin-antitoxin system HicA family toxin [Microcoleus sp.]